MRIIAGDFRSRRLEPPPAGAQTRPMPDRVRESIFGFLRGHCEGAVVVDLFAGTGAVGLEAISRGAARCMFVERDKRVAETLRRNVAKFACEDRCEVVMGDALGASIAARAPRPATLVFFDPPYPLVTEKAGWERVRSQASRLAAALAPDGFLIVRTPWPFVFGGPDPEAEEEEPAPRQRPARGARHKTGRVRWHEMPDAEEEEIPPAEWGMSADEIAAIHDRGAGAELEAPEPAPATAAPPVREHADLRIAGLDGPETHVYRYSAVHLYALPRESAPA